MNSIAHEIVSGASNQALLDKYKGKGLTEKLLGEYRFHLNHILDNPDVSDEAREEYIAALNRNYQK